MGGSGFYFGKNMASAEREPIIGVWGFPQRGLEAQSLVWGSGVSFTPLMQGAFSLPPSHITSHHIETTDAGLDGLCIREIKVYHTNL